jgi:hypothetical protein
MVLAAPIPDGVGLSGIHGESRRRDDMPKEFYRRLVKGTFTALGSQTMLTTTLQNSSQEAIADVIY